MRSERQSPSFKGLQAASKTASTTARAASRKAGSRCELVLRKALWKLGLRYRIVARDLPGRPDVVFWRARVVVFCVGDFWHGRDIEAREAKLAAGHNPTYWIAKIRANVERDRRQGGQLESDGWVVLRFWEGDILANPTGAAAFVADTVSRRLP